MQKEAVSHRGLYQTASYLALVSALLIIGGLVCLIIFPMPDAQSSLSERLNFISQQPLEWSLPYSILFVWLLLQIPISIALYRLNSPKHPDLNLTATILGTLGILLLLHTTFLHISAIPRMAEIFTTTGDELLKYAMIANFNGDGLIQAHSFSFSQMILAMVLLGGMFLLVGISLMLSAKLSKVIGWLLFLAGIFSVVGLAGYLAREDLLEMAFLVQVFLYFSALLLMFPMFQQHASTN
jgi:hypothetical protein